MSCEPIAEIFEICKKFYVGVGGNSPINTPWSLAMDLFHLEYPVNLNLPSWKQEVKELNFLLIFLKIIVSMKEPFLNKLYVQLWQIQILSKHRLYVFHVITVKIQFKGSLLVYAVELN